MFERWTLTEIVAVGAAALAVAYMMFEVSRRQKHLREVVNLIGGYDAWKAFGLPVTQAA